MELRDKGQEITEQKHAEKLRSKRNKIANMKSGTKKTIVTGLAAKSTPMDVMKEEYSRRKYERQLRRESKESSDKVR